MTRLLWISCFIVLGCLLLPTYAGNCSSTDTILIRRASVEYEITGGEVFVFPSHNGVRSEQTYLRWDLSLMVERNKTVRTVTGVPIPPACTKPRLDGIGALDPLEPYYSDISCTGSSTGRPCGPLVSYLDFKDMNCYVEHVITEFHGFERESVYVHYTHPSYPDFKTVAANHLLNGYLDVYPIPNNTLVVNRYVPDSLKISYEILSYPWGSETDYEPGNPNMASTISIWWDSTISIAPGNISASHDDITRRVLSYKSEDLTTELGIDIASVFAADGAPFLDPDNGDLDLVVFQYPLALNITFSTNLCNETLGKWTHLEYDPSFNAIFNPPIQPENSDSPGPAKSGLSGTQIAVISVVVPIVIITALIAIGYTVIRPRFMQKLPKK